MDDDEDFAGFEDDGNLPEDLNQGDDPPPSDPQDHQQSDPEPASRGDRDYGRLRAERREAEERAARLEREMADLRSRYETSRQRDEEAERRARYEAMDPYERQQAETNDRLNDLNRRLEQDRIERIESTDAAEFRALAAENPLLGRIRDKVEEQFQALKRAGTPTNRTVIAKYLLGEQLLEKGAKALKTKTTEANGRRAAQAARPSSSRGDAPAPDRGQRPAPDEREARRQRLENVRL